MAEHILRPKKNETWPLFSRRLARIQGSNFEKVRAMALALEEDWREYVRHAKAGPRGTPDKNFQVRLVKGEIVVRCLTPQALCWDRIHLIGEQGFAGLNVRVEDAREVK